MKERSTCWRQKLIDKWYQGELTACLGDFSDCKPWLMKPGSSVAGGVRLLVGYLSM